MPTESQLRDTALRLRVRERIEDGRLPVMLPKAIFAGYGAGNLCLACDQPITPAQIEYELDHDVNGSPYRQRLHLGCHVIWQIECHERISGQRHDSRVSEI
jgi:hypothetical protein